MPYIRALRSWRNDDHEGRVTPGDVYEVTEQRAEQLIDKRRQPLARRIPEPTDSGPASESGGPRRSSDEDDGTGDSDDQTADPPDEGGDDQGETDDQDADEDGDDDAEDAKDQPGEEDPEGDSESGAEDGPSEFDQSSYSPAARRDLESFLQEHRGRSEDEAESEAESILRDQVYPGSGVGDRILVSDVDAWIDAHR